jgi:hypothetical protein
LSIDDPGEQVGSPAGSARSVGTASGAAGSTPPIG